MANPLPTRSQSIPYPFLTLSHSHSRQRQQENNFLLFFPGLRSRNQTRMLVYPFVRNRLLRSLDNQGRNLLFVIAENWP